MAAAVMPAELPAQPPGCNYYAFKGHNVTALNWTSSRLCPGGGVMLVETMNDDCKLFQLIVSLVVIGAMCGLGLVGNVLSMITLQKDNVHTVTTFLLSSLCVADISFILPAMTVIMLPSYCQYFQHCPIGLRQNLPFVEQFGWAVVSFCHSCTVYMTVLVAVHRYFFVCRPHDCHRLSGLARARRQAIAIPIVRIVRIRDFDTNTTFIETFKTLTSFADNPWFQVIYKSVLYCAVMFVIPLCLLVVLSVRLLRSLYQRRVSGTKNQSAGGESRERRHKRRDDNITLVLVIIIGVFVVCQAPMLAQRLLLATSTDDDAHKCGHAYFYVEQTANLCAVLNSCVNFAIYFLFAGRFRQTLLTEVLHCKGRTQGSTLTEMEQRNGTQRSRCYDDDSKHRLVDASVTTQTMQTGDVAVAPLLEPQLENKATSTEGLDAL
ncbi:hypothetical protein CAPTEDRAFT_193821 [Capitella teleta]|uniref:G-protein coupled receptors family 1 profile domain-containing protein n=1 Tax=Capitella teleta TaxID=283909 RepID=R7UYL8_CAPTE|nr:hypothetical protein CAPTEDRAFT_193821 [Capitella teleta]|eukprot:ELU11419.1 hypothetical protein CAPTEDRAFT_193821 [Capitella teleta]